MKLRIVLTLSALLITASCYKHPEEVALMPIDNTESTTSTKEPSHLLVDTLGIRYYAGASYTHLLTDEARAMKLKEPWQIPSREDARIIRQYIVFGSERLLCFDDSTQTYYTFVKTGSLTRAGEKTRYTLQIIRKDTVCTDISISIHPF